MADGSKKHPKSSITGPQGPSKSLTSPPPYFDPPTDPKLMSDLPVSICENKRYKKSLLTVKKATFAV